MPTSYGLSYWIHSLPRSAWPTGDLTRSAKAITSSCAPAVPLPQNSVTRSAVVDQPGQLVDLGVAGPDRRAGG